MYNVHRLRLLREVHLRGTLAATAEALGYNPSSVSHQIALLEREAGVTLLEPVGRGVRLTDAALILVEHTEQILRHLEEAEADIAAVQEIVRGTVRVATFQTAAHTVVPRVLRDLSSAHPALSTQFSHILVGEALPALLARDFDLVLQEDYPGHPRPRVQGVEVSPAVRDPLYLLTHVTDDASHLADVADRPWVMEPAGTPSRLWAVAECRRAGFEPTVVVESADVLLHVQLAAAGIAVALAPQLAIRNTAGVRALDLSGHPERTISTAVRRGSARTPSIEVVRSAISRELERQTTRRA